MIVVDDSSNALATIVSFSRSEGGAFMIGANLEMSIASKQGGASSPAA